MPSLARAPTSPSTTGSNEPRTRRQGGDRHRRRDRHRQGDRIRLAFSAAGARLVVNHHDSPDLAEAVAVAADVSSRSEFEALVSAVAIERFGPWDVLVNNAGIALVKPFGEVTEDEFDKSFQVNVKGTFHGCQLALSRMADGGRIINISSSTTALMLPGYGGYDATKGAIEAMSHVIAKEFGRGGNELTVLASSYRAAMREL